MDSEADAARPWIEAAAPSYPALIDRNHRVAELYNMVNVPQAVWIDETGTIVLSVVFLLSHLAAALREPHIEQLWARSGVAHTLWP